MFNSFAQRLLQCNRTESVLKISFPDTGQTLNYRKKTNLSTFPYKKAIVSEWNRKNFCAVFKSGYTYYVCKSFSFQCFRKIHSNIQRPVILGIETSCDDTGAAIVDSDGQIIGEALHSQHQTHLNFGGIIPTIAKDLHVKHIRRIVDEALEKSEMTLSDVDAIATTVKPGLALSLHVGLAYSKELIRKCRKPFIPIHHMEAHALVVRMIEKNKVKFPFLVLLASGGHCQIAVVKSVSEFLLLGTTIDDAPGEAFDKVARRLKVRNLKECSTLSGGAAIELLAKSGDPQKFEFPLPLSRYRDCNFSFSGLKFTASKFIMNEEEIHGIKGDGIIPSLTDFCASFQHAITKHLIRRVHRAMVFCEIHKLLPEENLTFVISGGVACNQYIRSAFQVFCSQLGYKLICPPPRLCCDNGLMIAWNGIERFTAGIGIAHDPEAVDFEPKCPLGKDLIKEVQDQHIKLKRIKIVPAEIQACNLSTI